MARKKFKKKEGDLKTLFSNKNKHIREKIKIYEQNSR